MRSTVWFHIRLPASKNAALNGKQGFNMDPYNEYKALKSTHIVTTYHLTYSLFTLCIELPLCAVQ